MRAADLLDRDGLADLLPCRALLMADRRLRPPRAPGFAAGVAAAPMISLTFLPRRAATERGVSCAFSASNVARTML